MNDDQIVLTVLGICLILAGIATIAIYMIIHMSVKMITRCKHYWIAVDLHTNGWGVACNKCNMVIASYLTEHKAIVRAAYMNGEEPNWREHPTDFPDAEWKKGKKDDPKDA